MLTLSELEVGAADSAEQLPFVLGSARRREALDDGRRGLRELIHVGLGAAQHNGAIHLRRVERPVRDAHHSVRQVVRADLAPAAESSKLSARVRLDQLVQHLERVVPAHLRQPDLVEKQHGNRLLVLGCRLLDALKHLADALRGGVL